MNRPSTDRGDPTAEPRSLLMRSAVQRIGGALLLSLGLWLAVAWALAGSTA